MFKKLTEDAKLPTRATKYSAGVDVYANEGIVIGAGETAIVPLGIAIDLKNLFNRWYQSHDPKSWQEFMESHYLSLKPRSSLRVKGLISHSGVIDLDYEDELKMIIYNPYNEFSTFDNTKRGALGNRSFCIIKKGDRIGQLLLMEHKSHLMGIKSEDERNGGFGSTGS